MTTARELWKKVQQERPDEFGQLIESLDGTGLAGDIRDLIEYPSDEPVCEVYWAREAKDERPPVPWIVHGLIKPATLNVVYGEGGCGKTWAMLDMGVQVSTGKAWLDRSTLQSTVLFIDEESGKDYFLERVSAVLSGHFIQHDIPLAAISYGGFNDLWTTDTQNKLHEKILETGAGVVFIDALADVLLGRNENLVGDVVPLFHGLRQVALQTGAAIVIIHHANRMGGYRGSSAIMGAVDLLLQQQLSADRFINYNVEKGRRGKKNTFHAVAHWTQNEHDDVIEFFMESTDEPKKDKSEYTSGEQFVLKYLLANPDSYLKVITGAADTCSPRTARNAVYSLAKKHLVFRTNPDESGAGTEASYSLTDAGTPMATSLP